MNITQQVRDLLDTNDTRFVGRIGSNQMFTDECDHCWRPAVILTETITELARGAEREGGIYCLEHGIEAVDDLTWNEYDEINVTVPADLLATDLAA